MCLTPTHRACRSVASDTSIKILKFSLQADLKVFNLHGRRVKRTSVTLTAKEHGHSLESQRLYDDQGDTHKSCFYS